MRDGDPLPDSDHVATYCSPGKLADGGRRPTFQVFMLRPSDDHVSGHWLEFFERATMAEAMEDIRREAGSGTETVYRRSRNGQYAVLNVGEARTAGPNVSVRKIDGEYESHAGICGLEQLAEEDQQEVAKVLSGLVGEMFPAVEN